MENVASLTCDLPGTEKGERIVGWGKCCAAGILCCLSFTLKQLLQHPIDEHLRSGGGNNLESFRRGGIIGGLNYHRGRDLLQAIIGESVMALVTIASQLF